MLVVLLLLTKCITSSHLGLPFVRIWFLPHLLYLLHPEGVSSLSCEPSVYSDIKLVCEQSVYSDIKLVCDQIGSLTNAFEHLKLKIKFE